ncbi:MAG: hypothetical protein PHX45_01685 [Acidobacteriota bacterium]|nr:hypothetical protein [Acidobacteriota bacterium]
MIDRTLRFARALSLALALTFAAVGLLFLWIPEGVLQFFNGISEPLGFRPSPVPERDFYLVLAVAYMWTVTWLAWKMYLRPRERIFPSLLVQAKTASSVLSLGFYFLHGHYLIYLVNASVDGLIAIAAGFVFLRRKRGPAGTVIPAPSGEESG